MIKTAIICILVACVIAEEATNATGGTKESVGKGYGNGYGGHDDGYGPGPGYGYPPYGPPPPPHFYDRPHRRRDYDSHYCSVHASFALALSRDEGGNGGGYGNDYNDRSRRFTRQFCRYAAAHSKDSCSFCCRIAARSANTSPDDITSAIFSFDPINPTAFGAGAEDYKDDNYNNGPYRQKRGSDGGRIRQCVCCAPKDD